MYCARMQLLLISESLTFLSRYFTLNDEQLPTMNELLLTLMGILLLLRISSAISEIVVQKFHAGNDETLLNKNLQMIFYLKVVALS